MFHNKQFKRIFSLLWTGQVLVKTFFFFFYRMPFLYIKKLSKNSYKKNKPVCYYANYVVVLFFKGRHFSQNQCFLLFIFFSCSKVFFIQVLKFTYNNQEEWYTHLGVLTVIKKLRASISTPNDHTRCPMQNYRKKRSK